jgi:hypothetical protein
MRGWIKKALTRTISIKGRRREIEVPPSDRLLYGVYFAMAALTALTLLEATYMIVLHRFSSEIFATITLVIGTILGAFFGQKG